MGYLQRDTPSDGEHSYRIDLCSCQTPRLVARLQRVSGLIDYEREVSLDQIIVDGRPGTAEMCAACLEFLGHPAGILTICGNVGNGKTMALMAVVNELVQQGIPAVYVVTPELLSYIRAAYDPGREDGDEDARERLQRFEEIKILALDEFDKVHVTGWVEEQISQLIDRRYRLGLAGRAGTLIAMNSDPGDQRDDIVSRLYDRRNRIVHNADPDLRGMLQR